MESLAFMVVIILAISTFSGPIALLLTWIPALNRESTSNPVRLIRRIFVTFFTVLGSFVSFNLFIVSLNLVTTVIAGIGSVSGFFAVKREYFPNGFGFKKFGGGSDRRNGPSGQH
jgi:ABC-type arginine transport system permease subunit